MVLEYTLIERVVLIINFLFAIILGTIKIIEFFESRTKIKIESLSYGLGIRKRRDDEPKEGYYLSNYTINTIRFYKFKSTPKPLNICLFYHNVMTKIT